MRILISGGAGFIGSHLTDRLLSDGHTVTILDRFTHGEKEHRNGNSKKILIFHKIDITDPKQVKQKFFKDVDWVFHLVATKKNNPDPCENHRVNLDSTLYMLEASRTAGVKKFIYIGAAACYGKPEKNPVKEEARLQLSDPYKLTKFMAEQYALHWGKVYKLPVLILRMFNTYGPQIRIHGGWGPTLSVFLLQKKQGIAYTVRGDGNQLRDFTYISDAIDALIIAASSDVINEIINIGTGSPTSVNMMLELLGGKKLYLPKIHTEPEQLYPDVTKAKKLLGWHARVSLKEGIQHVLKKFQEIPGI